MNKNNYVLNNKVVLKKMPENNRGYSNQKEIDTIIEEGLNQYFQISYGKKVEDCILPESKIIIKPNFVSEMNFNVSRDKKVMENPNDCFITNIAVIKAILKFLNKIKGLNVKIVESPMQFCRMDKIMTDSFWTELRNSFDGTIEFVDLRRTIVKLTDEGMVTERETDRRALEDYVDFDLKTDSMLCVKERRVNRFRVTDYPPREMKKFHGIGKHVYRIARELIEADWIISVPKLKTHMKAGITGAMKNYVGVVGNKECLPHHIKGAPITGGDCHEDVSLLKFLSENFLDVANGFLSKNENLYRATRKLSTLCMSVHYRIKKEKDLAGSWWGNDTIWRTVYDLNVLMYYGQLNGSIADTQQRNVLTITDAIVTGQKDGPMRPYPCYTNAIVIGSSTVCVDMVNAALMHFDGKKILHFDEMCQKNRFKLFYANETIKVWRNKSKEVGIGEIFHLESVYHEASPGWKKILN